MNLDELIHHYSNLDIELISVKLVEILNEWKADNSNVHDLEILIEKYFGNIWLPTNDIHDRCYQQWSKFRLSAIGQINGMTMNERLYWFSLFERFDNCKTENQKQDVYSKLYAKT
ncbi:MULTISPECIES: hypothetical protein [unclassified Pseudoalteromonas]|uniref:hypothetical protein n=1 Tax=unclassified Pseudoalteromonas TaxID=194690 RepID=UPI000C07F9A2|nr:MULTISPECIES: hypothetical protein [unclassified Pseudoalteromonas]MDP2634630.1 hypothetical protein [Pseudoalteromonas sp. 1_MG-2023]PHN91168.1 hypothetical protein CSC79_02615 [Pseudoalteromonas sp. 3D05]